MSEPPATPRAPLLDAGAASRLLHALSEPDSAAPVRATYAGPTGYIIDRAIGAGGGGSVFRAFREGSDRPVALKLIDYRLGHAHADPSGGHADSRGADRARRELRLLQDLHLPALPRVIDHGIDPATGRLYIATEFIDGRTLDEHCRAAALDLRARVTLLAGVADAVQSLHDHGVIHRDLKPSNILIDRRGDPILIDLGIASMLSEFGAGPASTLTEEGRPIGTPAFMAPEQARGERARISTRSDVYGLGATAFKLLTGETPHDVDTTIHEAIRRVAMDEPRDPRLLDPSLPRPLGAVLSRACHRDPARRYASASAFADDLRRWLRAEPVEAQPPGAWLRAVRWAARHPVLVTAGACVLMLAGTLGLTTLSVWWWDRMPHQVVQVSPFEARLLARSGHVLKSWHSADATTGSAIPLAAWVERPAHLGGGHVAVTVISDDREHPESSGQLAIWDPSDLSRPVWSSPGTLVPPRDPRPTDNSYHTNSAAVADVFEELEGPEIIATHNQVYSPSALRVYDLAGNVLYEAWHVGSVGNALWLAEPRQFVVSGCDNTHPWQRLGYEVQEAYYPTVLFSVVPQNGARLGFVNGGTPDPRVQVPWYRWVHPHGLPEILGVSLQATTVAATEGCRLFVHFRPLREAMRDWSRWPLGAGTPSFTLEIDGTGAIVDRMLTDGFPDAAAELVKKGVPAHFLNARGEFDDSVITLGELPKPKENTTTP